MVRKIVLRRLAEAIVVALAVGCAFGAENFAVKRDEVGNSVVWSPWTPGGPTKFTTIVFGHGTSIGVDSYAYVWKSFVPRGYVVAMPRLRRFAPFAHKKLAHDTVEAAERASAAYGGNGQIVLGGHSIGGLAAVAAANTLGTKGVVVAGLFTFAVAVGLENPAQGFSDVPLDIDYELEAPAVTIPALIVYATKDTVIFGNKRGPDAKGPDSKRLFNKLGSNDKHLTNHTNATHCKYAAGLTSGPFVCTIAERAGLLFHDETLEGSRPPGMQRKETLAYVAGFLQQRLGI